MESSVATETDNLCEAQPVDEGNEQEDLERGLRLATPPPTYVDIPGVIPSATATLPGPPPSYDEANDLDALPPSYNSLFGQVKEVRRSSSGPVERLQKIAVLLCGSIGCTIIIGITVIIPLSMIYIGFLYFNDCPVEHYIPVFLIVGGVFGFLKNMVNSCRHCMKRLDEEEASKTSSFDVMLNVFLFTWFITGSVWVYSVYEPEYYWTTASNYCNKTLYLFSFWLVTSLYVALAVCVCCICTISEWSTWTNSD